MNTSGTAYVKATASGIAQAVAEQSVAAVLFATPAEKFTGVNQSGGYTLQGAVQKEHISYSASNAYAFVQLWAVMQDLKPDLTISNVTYQMMYEDSYRGDVNSSLLNWKVPVNWVNGHIYRSAFFVVAEALAGGPGNNAEAHTNFTLTSLTWDASQDFPAVQVNVPASVAMPPKASRGDTITVSGYGFRPNENDKIKLIAIDSNGRPITGGTNQVVVQSFNAGTGNFQQSFKVPSNATPVPGNYAVRIANVTSNDAVDAAISLSLPIVGAPTLPPNGIVSLLLALAAVPIVIKRVRPKIQ